MAEPEQVAGRQAGVRHEMDHKELEKYQEFELDLPHQFIGKELFLGILHLYAEQICSRTRAKHGPLNEV